jgi:imidazolonepropionase
MNSLWFAAFLALVKGGFAISEVLTGVTRHAAKAMGVEATHGVLRVGLPAQMIMFEGSCPEDFFATPLGDHLKAVII